jgi:type IV pilus assembly protein PilB
MQNPTVIFTAAKKAAVEEGMITLRQSGLIKIKAGITTMEEVIRETVL